MARAVHSFLGESLLYLLEFEVDEHRPLTGVVLSVGLLTLRSSVKFYGVQERGLDQPV